MSIPAGMLISTRDRDVWTTDERKLLNRTAKIINAHGDKFLLRCGNPVCPDPRIILQQDDTAPSGRILRCGCTDRQFVPSC